MTENDYKIALKHLVDNNPNHPLVPELTEGGYSDLNVIYLSHVLKDLPPIVNRNNEVVNRKPEIVNRNAEIINRKSEIVNPQVDDSELKKLYIEKSRLFTERAKLSNRLHEFPLNAKHNAHRAGVMDGIRVKQSLIERIFKTIEYYEANGRLPADKVVDERWPIPADLYERRLKLNAVNASLSRWKTQMHEAIAKSNHKRAEEIGVFIDEYTVYKRSIIGAFRADGVDILERKKES